MVWQRGTPVIFILVWIALPLGWAESSTPLEPGDLHTRTITHETLSHDFHVDLEKGQFVELRVTQKGIDVTEWTSAPDGSPLVRFDSANSDDGSEPVLIVAETSGRYGVRIDRQKWSRGEGDFEVEVVAKGIAGDAERRRLEAEKAFSNAGTLKYDHKTASYERAIELYRSALPVFLEQGDVNREADTRIHIADMHLALRQPREALKEYRPGYELLKKIGQERRAGVTRMSMGHAHRSLAEYQASLESYRDAQAIFELLGSIGGLAGAEASMGLIHWTLGDHRRALAHYESAVEAYDEFQYFGGKAISLLGAARAYEALGRIDAASENYDEAYALLQGSTRSRRMGQTLLGLARVAAAREEIDRAETHVDEALTFFLTVGDQAGAARAHLIKARLEQARSDWSAARGEIDASLRLARETQDREATASALFESAKLHDRVGNTRQALDAIGDAIAIIDIMRDSIRDQEYRASFLSSKQSYFDLYIDLLVRADQLDVAKIFTLTEKARARSLLEEIAISRMELWRTLPGSSAEREAQIAADITAISARIARSDDTKERRRLIEELRAKESEREEWVSQLSKTFPRQAFFRQPVATSVEEVQAELGPDEALVTYKVLDEQVLAIVLTREDAKLHEIDIHPDDLSQSVANLVDLVTDSQDRNWRRVARRLGEVLVDSWVADLPRAVAQLTVIPDRELHYLPFEMLLIQRSGPPDLMLRSFSVSYAPSAMLLRLLETSPRSEPVEPLLVVADPIVPGASGYSETRTWEEFESDGFTLQPLAHAGEEAEAVGQFATDDGAVLTRRQATEQRVKSASLIDFNVLHFATHALVVEDAPRRSALLLSPPETEDEDGFLSAREIYDLDLSCELVVLSACRTARGKLLAGEGVQGLSQAFFYAGAQSVLASLWDVDDAATAVFMDHFYEGLAAGASKREALHQAKLSLLDDPDTRSPHLWAPFVLIGDADRQITLPRRSAGRAFQFLPVVILVVALTMMVMILRMMTRPP